MSKTAETNPFADVRDFLYQTFYTQPKNFVAHSLDDVTEDVVKVGVTYGFYCAANAFGMGLPLKLGSVVVGYYVGNEVGDFVGEYVESGIKYSMGISEEDTLPRHREEMFESFVDDITEDTVKVVGMAYLLKSEFAAYVATSYFGAAVQATGTNVPNIVRAVTIASGVSKFVEEYHVWNEYSNKAGNFVAREVTEKFSDMFPCTYDFISSFPTGDYMCCVEDF